MSFPADIGYIVNWMINYCRDNVRRANLLKGLGLMRSSKTSYKFTPLGIPFRDIKMGGKLIVINKLIVKEEDGFS